MFGLVFRTGCDGHAWRRLCASCHPALSKTLVVSFAQLVSPVKQRSISSFMWRSLSLLSPIAGIWDFAVSRSSLHDPAGPLPEAVSDSHAGRIGPFTPEVISDYPTYLDHGSSRFTSQVLDRML
jgi:hypothetical protein